MVGNFLPGFPPYLLEMNCRLSESHSREQGSCGVESVDLPALVDEIQVD
jgi:hypothetical protein